MSYTQRDAERELAARTEIRGQTPTTERERVMSLGFTEEEAECWVLAASVAGKFFSLPDLHPMDDHEVAHAIHVVQSKLLSRPAYRRYLEFAREGTSEAPRPTSGEENKNIEEGVRAGVQRAGEYGLSMPPDAIENAKKPLNDVVKSWPDDLSERFVTLFAENATVASIARSAYSDAPLTAADLTGYLGYSVAFFNSFRHR